MGSEHKLHSWSENLQKKWWVVLISLAGGLIAGTYGNIATAWERFTGKPIALEKISRAFVCRLGGPEVQIADDISEGIRSARAAYADTVPLPETQEKHQRLLALAGDFGKLGEKAPHLPQLRLNQGICLLRAGQLEPAAEKFREELQVAQCWRNQSDETVTEYLLAVKAKQRMPELLTNAAFLATVQTGASLAHYNLACVHSLRSNPEEGMEELTKAVAGGFTNCALLKSDPDLDYLRKLPAFRSVLPGCALN